MGYFKTDELYHHGILGQKWGVRRYENENGTLTAAGRKRYDTDENGDYKRLTDKQIENTKNYKRLKRKAEEEGYKKYSSDFWENAGEKEYFDAVDKIQRNAKKEALEKYKNGETAKSPLQEKLSDPKVKAAIAIGATLAVAGVAAYGGYKLHQISGVKKAEHAKALMVAAKKQGVNFTEVKKVTPNVTEVKKVAVNTVKPNLADKKQADIAKKSVKYMSEGLKSSTNKFEFEKFMPEKFDFDKFEYANNELVNDLLKKNNIMLGL